jgi:hypothetical protein
MTIYLYYFELKITKNRLLKINRTKNLKRVKKKEYFICVLVEWVRLLNVACSKVEKETDKKVKLEKKKLLNIFDKVDFAGEQAPLK